MKCFETAYEMEEFALEFFSKDEIYEELIRWMSEERKVEFFNDFFRNNDLINALETERAIRFIADNIEPTLMGEYENNAYEYASALIEQRPELLEDNIYLSFEYWHYSESDFAIDVSVDHLYNKIIEDVCAINWGFESAFEMEQDGYHLFYDYAFNGVIVLQPKNIA